MIDFDALLSQIGDFGRGQITLAFVVGYTAVLSGFNTMSAVFINYTPDYRLVLNRKTVASIQLYEKLWF